MVPNRVSECPVQPAGSLQAVRLAGLFWAHSPQLLLSEASSPLGAASTLENPRGVGTPRDTVSVSGTDAAFGRPWPAAVSTLRRSAGHSRFQYGFCVEVVTELGEPASREGARRTPESRCQRARAASLPAAVWQHLQQQCALRCARSAAGSISCEPRGDSGSWPAHTWACGLGARTEWPRWASFSFSVKEGEGDRPAGLRI